MQNPPSVYVLNYQVLHETQMPIVESWLRNDPDIIDVLTAIPLLYFFKSYRPANHLMMKMAFLFRGGSFVICKIDTTSIDGMLPKEAWDWFYNNKQSSEPNPPPLGSLGSLFGPR